MSGTTTAKSAVRFVIAWTQGEVTNVATNSPEIKHFLDVVRMTRSYHTWVNYVHDLKCFFQIIPKRPAEITRADCLTFMQQQDASGYADATINRRLAAVSSLFNELTLLDPVRFPHNPIFPRPYNSTQRQPKLGFYSRHSTAHVDKHWLTIQMSRFKSDGQEETITDKHGYDERRSYASS